MKKVAFIIVTFLTISIISTLAFSRAAFWIIDDFKYFFNTNEIYLEIYHTTFNKNLREVEVQIIYWKDLNRNRFEPMRIKFSNIKVDLYHPIRIKWKSPFDPRDSLFDVVIYCNRQLVFYETVTINQNLILMPIETMTNSNMMNFNF